MDFVPGTGASNEFKLEMGRARRLHRTRHTSGWQQPLRFEIGACVRCMCDERWSKGRVVALNYEEPKVCYHPTISSLLNSLHFLSSSHLRVWILSAPPRHRLPVCVCQYVPCFASLSVFLFTNTLSHRGCLIRTRSSCRMMIN